MDGKSCIITGANSGIGKETARGLAKLGAHVIMVCRDHDKGEEARQDLIAEADGEDGGNPNPQIDLLIADLSSQSSIRNLATDIRSEYETIDVLINNAGLIMGNHTLTEDGIEWTFAVNHLAPFLLTNLIIEPLLKAHSARIVTVSSGAHHMGKIDFDDLQARKGFRGFRVYSNSKLANVLFTKGLSRMLQGTGITANCLHPGVVRTNFGRSASPLFHMMFVLGNPFMISPKRGAATSVYLASSPDVEGVSGEYFRRKKIARSSQITHDATAAKRLWEMSSELTKLKPDERLESKVET